MAAKSPYFDTINDAFKVYFLSGVDSQPFKFHYHESFEIYLCLTENMAYLINDQYYQMTVGDLVIVNSRDIHKPLPPVKGKYDRALVLFDLSYLEGYSTQKTDLLKFFHHRKSDFTHKIHLNQRDLEDFLKLLKEKTQLSGVYGSDVLNKCLLARILLFINQRYESDSEPAKPNHTLDINQMHQLLIYLHKHYQDPLPLDLLARQFYSSKNKLNNKFKTYTGMTIHRYLVEFRLMVAKRLLLEEGTVTEVCEKSGFSNLSHFIRSFTAEVGMPPSQYRKEKSLSSSSRINQ